VRIDGLFELKQAHKKFARPGQIRIRIGAPISFPRETPPEAIANELQKRVKGL